MKWALVTGASSGIGLELTKILAKNKYNLVIASRKLEVLKKISEELVKKYDIKVYPISIDLSKDGSAKQLYDEIKSLNINIDLLVNNAGIGDYGYFIDSDIDKVNQMMVLNNISLVNLTYYFIQDMQDNNFGRIINVGSIASFFSGPLMAVYYATKAFVLSFSESLNEELKDYNIKVTCLCPGTTDTNFFKNANAKLTKSLLKSPEYVANKGYDAMLKNKRIEVPGLLNKIIVKIPRFIPRLIMTKGTYFVQKTFKGDKDD